MLIVYSGETISAERCPRWWGRIKNSREAIGLKQNNLKGRIVSKLEVPVQQIGCGCHHLHAWWHFFFSNEVGDKSINLLEVRGWCRPDFWKMVKDGRMIDRCHWGPVEAVVNEFAMALVLKVLRFLRQVSIIQHRKEEWHTTELTGDPQGKCRVRECMRVFRALMGAVFVLEPWFG